MRRIKDLTGQTFGELTALVATNQRYFGNVVWKCKCSCGKEYYAASNALTSGQVTSCGHLRGAKLSGRRFGRLVVIKAQKQRKNNGIVWLCKCDCGGVTLSYSAELLAGSKKSCGCLRWGKAVCPACGEKFEIPADGSPTPQFCPSCAPTYSGRNWKVCPICKKLFSSPPSSKTVTCSKECSSTWRRLVHEGISFSWNEASLERKRAEGQTENLKLGTAAAQKSPICGRFETNREAKIWTLIDPSGNEITVRNLLLWARENTSLFGKPQCDRSASQIAHGFAAIAQTMRGVRKTPAMTYFGWTLKGPPENPE